MANSTTAEHAVIRRDISKFKWTMMQVKQHKVAYLMIAPFFILFFIFTVVPVLLSIVLSFTTFNLLEWPTLVYADNYIRLFLDDLRGGRLGGLSLERPQEEMGAK